MALSYTHSMRTRAMDESGLRELGAHLRVPGLSASCELLQQKHTSHSGGSDLGCPWASWLISSVIAIRSLCNHIQVQITGLVSEPINPEPRLSSWHLLAGITHLRQRRPPGYQHTWYVPACLHIPRRTNSQNSAKQPVRYGLELQLRFFMKAFGLHTPRVHPHPGTVGVLETQRGRRHGTQPLSPVIPRGLLLRSRHNQF